jgi:hypothetical protein
MTQEEYDQRMAAIEPFTIAGPYNWRGWFEKANEEALRLNLQAKDLGLKVRTKEDAEKTYRDWIKNGHPGGFESLAAASEVPWAPSEGK